MRVAFFVDAFPVISETFILNQITGLIDRGHEVDIYTRTLRSLSSSPHPQVEQYQLLKRTHLLNHLNLLTRFIKATMLLWSHQAWAKPATWSALKSILSARDTIPAIPRLGLLEICLTQQSGGPYDIIHCQFGTLGRQYLGLKKLGLISGKFVTSFRGYDITQHDNSTPGLYDELFSKGDLFLPVSHSLKQTLIERGCDPTRIHVLHSGIDCSQIHYSTHPWKDEQPLKILSICRLVEKKGISYAVEAVAALLKAGRKIQYDIVGDGPLKEAISRQIEEIGIKGQIILHGSQNHDVIKAYLADAHVFMAPSVTALNGDMEGIPNVVKEAMAAGLPVISALHGGIPELVEDGVSGFLVPERDTTALVDRLSYLMDHTELWEPMGAAGRKKIEQEFDSNKVNDHLIELYCTA